MSDRSINFGHKTLTLEEYRAKEPTLDRPLTDGPMLVRRFRPKAEASVDGKEEAAAIAAKLLG